MRPTPKQSEVVTKAVLRIVDRLGMAAPEPARPVIYLRAPNELVIGKNHECEVYKLTDGQLANILTDAAKLVADRLRENLSVREAP